MYGLRLCIYVHINTYICQFGIRTCTYAMCELTYVIRTYTYVRMDNIHMYVRLYIFTYVHTYIRTYAHVTHAHMHTHTQLL